MVKKADMTPIPSTLSSGFRRMVDRRNPQYVVPAIALTLLVFLVPTLTAIYFSFFDWRPGVSGEFVGMENYLNILGDSRFQEALRNQALYLLGVPLWTFAPLALALFLYEKVPAASIFRTAYFLPAVIPAAIVALIFKTVLAPDGLVNSLLGQVGLGALARNWIDDPSLIKPTIIAITLWSSIGLGTLIYGSALSAISPEYFEAARLDGAGWGSTIRHVVWPEIRSTVFAFGALQIVSVFVYFFGTIVVLTNGGPGYSSATLDFDVYIRSILFGKFGQGAAESVILVGLLIGLFAALVLIGRVFPRISDRVPIRLVDSLDNLVSKTRRRRRRSIRRIGWSTRRGSILKVAIAILIAVPFVYPLLYLAATAVKTQSDFLTNRSGFPQSFTLDAFSTAWRVGNLGQAMLNSTLAVGVGVTLTVVISAFAGYWFFMHRSKGASLLYLVIVVFFAVPVFTWLLPLFVGLARVHGADNLVVLGIVYAATQIPVGIALITTFMRQSIPLEVLEAAAVDGAGKLRMLTAMVIPLTRPVIATVVALGFIFLWGDNAISLILIQDPNKFTSVVAATSVVAKANPAVREVAAAGLINLLPVLLVFFFAQRAITRGFLSGIGK